MTQIKMMAQHVKMLSTFFASMIAKNIYWFQKAQSVDEYNNITTALELFLLFVCEYH